MTVATPPFATVPFPVRHEHAAGYQRRLAIANGLDNLRQLKSLYGIEALSPRSNPITWERLSAATGLGDAHLEILAWPRIEGTHEAWLSVCDHPIRLAHLDLHHLTVCPDCIRKDGIVRSQWSLRHMTACPRHGTMLINRCSCCGRQSRIDARTDVWTCGECGTDMRDAAAARAPSADLAVSAALDTAFQKLPPLKTSPLPAELVGLAPGDMVAVIDRLATLVELAAQDRLTTDQVLSRRPSLPPPPSITEASVHIARAFSLLSDWPNAYLQLLVEFTRDVQTGSARINDRFPTVAGRLALKPLRTLAGEEITFLTIPTRGYLQDALGVAPRQRAPGVRAARPSTAPPVAFTAISHAAAMSKLEGRPIAALANWWIRAGLLAEHDASGGKVILSAEQVSDVRSRLDLLIGADSKTGHGVNIAWVNRFITAGKTYCKDDFLRDLFAGHIKLWPADEGEGMGLLGLKFDAHDIEIRRAVTRIERWIADGEHVRLDHYNAATKILWGPMGTYATPECDQLVAAGSLQFTYYHPPGVNSRRQRRYHVGDLVTDTQSWLHPHLIDVDAALKNRT